MKAGKAVEAADLPIPIDLPPAMFTGPGLLTLADLLPVMTAFVDRETRYRFINKPLAEWLGRSRRDMIAQGALPVVARRSASPSSCRTRPRLGNPERTSTLAR